MFGLVVPVMGFSSIVIYGDEIAPHHPYLHIQREYGNGNRGNAPIINWSGVWAMKYTYLGR
jgi:hypothetical protein